jgi:uncharacterized protein involved in cysteine biosynthesis
MGRFFHGFAQLGSALGMAFGDKKLRRLTLAPAALSLVVTLLSAGALFRYGLGLVERQRAGHGAFVAALLWVALMLAVAAATWLAWLCAGLVAVAPFADALSERAAELAGGRAPAPRRLGESLRHMVRGLGHTLLSLGAYLALPLPLFAAHVVVPVVAPATALLGLLLTAQFLAYDIFDPALSRHGRSYAEKWLFLRRHRAETLGLGLAAALASAVPLVGLLAPPLAIVAAGRLFVELDAPPMSKLT